jgi:hypothetical protein
LRHKARINIKIYKIGIEIMGVVLRYRGGKHLKTRLAKSSLLTLGVRKPSCK